MNIALFFFFLSCACTYLCFLYSSSSLSNISKAIFSLFSQSCAPFPSVLVVFAIFPFMSMSLNTFYSAYAFSFLFLSSSWALSSCYSFISSCVAFLSNSSISLSFFSSIPFATSSCLLLDYSLLFLSSAIGRLATKLSQSPSSFLVSTISNTPLEYLVLILVMGLSRSNTWGLAFDYLLVTMRRTS